MAGEELLKDMRTTYNISEKIKRMGRPRGWRKIKRTVPFKLLFQVSQH